MFLNESSINNKLHIFMIKHKQLLTGQNSCATEHTAQKSYWSGMQQKTSQHNIKQLLYVFNDVTGHRMDVCNFSQTNILGIMNTM